MPKSINLIAACAENRVIGHQGRLPWRIAEDMRFFLDKTRGQTVVIGRAAFAGWPSAASDGRQVVVVSRAGSPVAGGVRVAPTVDAALALAETLPGEIYVCGGQSIFEETLPRAARLYLTLVHAAPAGDRCFPEWKHLFTREIARRESRDENWCYTFLTLERA